MGCALQQGTTGNNIARRPALRAGLPDTVSGMTIDRQCSSGLRRSRRPPSTSSSTVPVMIGGGIEFDQPGPDTPAQHEPAWSIPGCRSTCPASTMPMIEHRRDRRRALRRQPRGAGRVLAAEPAAHRRGAAGRLRRRDRADDHHDGGHTRRPARRRQKRSRSPRTRATGPTPRWRASRSCSRSCGPDKCITAGNACQLSDGASAVVLMSEAKPPSAA